MAVLGVPGGGWRWTGDELDAAIDGPVAAVLFDDEGKANIEKILAGLPETNFEHEGLRRVFDDPVKVEDWRVGEAIAEVYLSEHRSCHFPWSDGRDERKSGSSLPGADLVGLGADAEGDCLAFGEVKTSRDGRHPPGVMHGQMGLRQQLEDLRDKESIRDGLFRYLSHRAREAPWRDRFKNAVRRYLRDKSDVKLYGFLVRDVEPDRDDLRMCVSVLGTDRPTRTRIELVALYLPQDSLDGFAAVVVARRKGARP